MGRENRMRWKQESRDLTEGSLERSVCPRISSDCQSKISSILLRVILTDVDERNRDGPK